MKRLFLTEHAIHRYIQRFAGNLSFELARARLERLVRRARFRRTAPGGAKLYTLGNLNFIVEDGCVVTVYRLQYRDAPALDLDFWHVPA